MNKSLRRYVRKDGSTAWVNVNMVVLRDQDGKPTRTVGMSNGFPERSANAPRFSM